MFVMSSASLLLVVHDVGVMWVVVMVLATSEDSRFLPGQ